METMICSFFGHRDVDVTERLYEMTKIEIMRAVELGCRTFYFGGYGVFDDLCREIVTSISKENPKLDSSGYTASHRRDICVNVCVISTARTMTTLYILRLPLRDGTKAFIFGIVL